MEGKDGVGKSSGGKVGGLCRSKNFFKSPILDNSSVTDTPLQKIATRTTRIIIA